MSTDSIVKVCRHGHERPATQMRCRTCKNARSAAYYRCGGLDTAATPVPRLDPTLIADHVVRGEWEHFAGYGMPDEQIAARLRVDLESLRRAASRRVATA